MVDCPICGLLHESFTALGIPMFACPRVALDRWFFILPGYGEPAYEFWAWRE